MNALFSRNLVSVVVIVAMVGALFSVAWQSRIFGLNTQSETVVVATDGGSSDATGKSAPAASPVAGATAAPPGAA